MGPTTCVKLLAFLHTQEVTDSSSVVSTKPNPLNRNGSRGFSFCSEVAFSGCSKQVFGAKFGQFGAISGAQIEVQKRGPPTCRGPPERITSSCINIERTSVMPTLYQFLPSGRKPCESSHARQNPFSTQFNVILLSLCHKRRGGILCEKP